MREYTPALRVVGCPSPKWEEQSCSLVCQMSQGPCVWY